MKLESLERLLEGDEAGLLDEAKLRGITSTGVPHQGGLRPVLWRVLLRYAKSCCTCKQRAVLVDFEDLATYHHAFLFRAFHLKPVRERT